MWRDNILCTGWANVRIRDSSGERVAALRGLDNSKRHGCWICQPRSCHGLSSSKDNRVGQIYARLQVQDFVKLQSHVERHD